MSYDSSDKSYKPSTPRRPRASRRALLAAAAGVGLLALNRLLVDSTTAGGTLGSGGGDTGSPGQQAAGGGARAAPGAGGLPTRILPGTGRRLALTFDDGPHPTWTPQILGLLRQHGAAATFFVIGENAVWQPDLLRAIAADGHLVANHSWSHPRFDRVPRDTVRAELGRTSEVIENVLGTPPRWARAPYGVWHPASLEICADLAMKPLDWSVDTADWSRPGDDRIAGTVLRRAHPGGIVLLHDGGGDRGQTVAALRYCLPRLADRGYDLVQPA